VYVNQQEIAKLERRHIRTTGHSLQEYKEGIETLLMWERITPKQAEWLRSRLRQCQAWNCDNGFIAYDLRQKYCSKACKREMDDASKRKDKTGTWLRVYDYKPKTMYASDREMERHAVSLTSEMGELLDLDGEFNFKKKPIDMGAVIDEEAEKYKKINEEMPIKVYKVGEI
jgi:hypothetical protein